jgi:hypothetical protein
MTFSPKDDQISAPTLPLPPPLAPAAAVLSRVLLADILLAAQLLPPSLQSCLVRHVAVSITCVPGLLADAAVYLMFGCEPALDAERAVAAAASAPDSSVSPDACETPQLVSLFDSLPWEPHLLQFLTRWHMERAFPLI